jgi:dihydrofolate synthase/folylpolyglutamate synthase
MMKYREILGSIYARDGKSSYYTLGRTRSAARGVGDPQDRFRAVHITGSNGKGSTARIIFEILHRSGLKTALYTSPHIHRYSERIRIGRREIPRREVARRFEAIERLRLDGKIPWITFFEITTLIAFGWFADEDVDMAVLEVGLGGRLDATNICRPSVSVITTVGLEHTNILGTTIAQITREKAGIIKERTPVVCGRLPATAEKIIRERVRRKKGTLIRLGREYLLRERGLDTFDYRGPRMAFDGLGTALPGRHQIHNAAVAVAAVEELAGQGVGVKTSVIPAALRQVKWEGRLERISAKPEIILDCAHNLPAIRNLTGQLNGRKFHLVFGALFDKPIEKMFARLRPLARKAYVSAPKVHRSPSLEELARRTGVRAYPTVSNALDAAVRDARRTGLPVLVTGSVFVVSEARMHFLGITNVDPPIAM